MPLPLPNLDDHDYADLVNMAQSLIPGECPEWTDHNPSDTGIILIELFAWLTELLLYQVNQVPDSSQKVFLQLLKGNARWTKPEDQSLQAATQATILHLRQRYRAVTAQDYKTLVIHDWPVSENAQALKISSLPIGRVQIFENRNLALAASEPTNTASGHISLVVLPQAHTDTSNTDTSNTDTLEYPSLDPNWQDSIWRFLNHRRLLGVKHHVLGPEYVNATITATIYPEPGRRVEQLAQIAKRQLYQFFHPLTGGDHGQGWPFGRRVYRSEVYQQLDQVPGIDYVDAVAVNLTFKGQTIDDLAPYQLVKPEITLTLPEAP